MKTSIWATYAGAGRIALSPPPHGTPGGYRLAPRGLYLRRSLPASEVRARLLDLDAWTVWADLHRLTYPAVPVLMGADPRPVCTYRRVVADWLAEASGRAVRELDPTTYLPGRVHPSIWRTPALPVFPNPNHPAALSRHRQHESNGNGHV